MRSVKKKSVGLSRAEFLRRRQRLGTREAVAAAMGVSRQTIFRWEVRGYHPVPGWAAILLGFLEAKYPEGLMGPAAIAEPSPPH